MEGIIYRSQELDGPNGLVFSRAFTSPAKSGCSKIHCNEVADADVRRLALMRSKISSLFYISHRIRKNCLTIVVGEQHLHIHVEENLVVMWQI